MSNLSDKLRRLCSDSENIYIPEYDDNDIKEDEEQPISSINLDEVEPKSSNKNKTKKSTIDKLMSDIDNVDKNRSDIIDDDDFDSFLESLSDDPDDEDTEFRNSIIDMGRKYARDTLMGESSEIQKVFSANEKKLQNLIKEIREDKHRISELMNKMSPRAASPKAMSELQDTKNTLHEAELSAIKESNSMKKSEVELSLKAKAQKGNEQSNISSGNLIRDLFSVGRKDMIDGMGGYEGVSGSFDDTSEEYDGTSTTINDNEESNECDDEVIQQKYFSEKSTSNNFIKYKDSGAHYILEIDDDGNKRIYAEDRNGNVLDDYPLPTDTSQLSFEFDSKTNMATDDYYRTYEVRKI